MKKILFILMAVTLLSSCGVTSKRSSYKLPRNPKVAFTNENISKIGNYQNLIGVGVSFSKGFTLIEGNTQNKREEIPENGVLNIFDIFSGYKLSVSKRIPVLYQDGSLHGKQVFLNGTALFQDMVGVISNVVVEDNVLTEVFVTIFSKDRKDELIFSLKEYNKSKKFFLKRKKISSSFSSEKINNLGLGTDQYGNIVLKQSNTFYYLLDTNNENFWFINKQDKAVYLENFFLNYQNIDNVKESNAVPIIVGGKKILKKK